VSTAANYSFSISTNRTLVAKFKPVVTLTTIADPPQGGEIDADKTFDPGDLAVVRAIPNNGYSFVNWTENGVFVSDDVRFQFNINSNRTLVGTFALGHRIDVSADPKTAGTVTGGGVYQGPATVTATPKTGYVFLGWTENGLTVNTDAEYTFIPAADRVLVANFAILPAVNISPESGSSLLFSWPSGAVEWVLQEYSEVNSGSWENSLRSITVVGSENQVTVPASEGRRFFRLVRP
jgi:uncharacterized repeat protein (TIGR02543 family)